MVNRMRGASLWVFLTGVLTVLAPGPATAIATFTAAVDRMELYSNEHVVLSLSLVDSETRLRAQGLDPNIDLTLLSEQFELGVPHTEFRFDLERRRATSELTVALFPRRAGRLTIPAFTVAGLSTRPITLQVRPPADDTPPEAFARSGVLRPTLWVGEQTLVFLDLFHRVNLKSAKLGGPLDTRPLEIEVHALPQGSRTEQVGGIDYNVTRTAWAVTPLRDEDITIQLPEIWVETREGHRLRLPAREERISVRPLPADVPTDVLVGRPRIEQAPFDTPAEVGGMVPWTITLHAPGGLNLLPRSLPLPKLPPPLRLYREPAERRLATLPDGRVESVVVYRGQLMPRAAGEYALPAITLTYFDTERGVLDRISLPGQRLKVKAAETPAQTAPPLPPGDEPPEAKPESKPEAKPATLSHTAASAWRAAALILGALWVATLAGWWYRWRRPRPVTAGKACRAAPPGTASPYHPMKARLLEALDAPTLEQGLRDWEARHGADAGLRATVRAVQHACYGRSAPQDPDTLAQAVERTVTRLHRATRQGSRVKGQGSE